LLVIEYIFLISAIGLIATKLAKTSRIKTIVEKYSVLPWILFAIGVVFGILCIYVTMY